MISRNVVQMSFSSNVIVFMDFFEDALQGYTTSHCFLNWSHKNSTYSSELQSSDTSFGGGIDWFAAEHDQVSLTYYASVEVNPKVNKWQRYQSFLDSFDKKYVIIILSFHYRSLKSWNDEASFPPKQSLRYYQWLITSLKLTFLKKVLAFWC